MTLPSSRGQSFTSRIAMWSARHRRIVVAVWVLALVVAIGACQAVGTNTDIDDDAPGDTGTAAKIIEDRFGIDDRETEGVAQEIVTCSHPTLRVTDDVYRETVLGLMGQLRRLRVSETVTAGSTTGVRNIRIVAETFTHYDTGLESAAGSPFVAENETGGHVTFALVQIELEAVADKLNNIDVVVDTVDSASEDAEGFEILVGEKRHSRVS